jgi:hypothetical protein
MRMCSRPQARLPWLKRAVLGQMHRATLLQVENFRNESFGHLDDSYVEGSYVGYGWLF